MFYAAPIFAILLCTAVTLFIVSMFFVEGPHLKELRRDVASAFNDYLNAEVDFRGEFFELGKMIYSIGREVMSSDRIDRSRQIFRQASLPSHATAKNLQHDLRAETKKPSSVGDIYDRIEEYLAQHDLKSEQSQKIIEDIDFGNHEKSIRFQTKTCLKALSKRNFEAQAYRDTVAELETASKKPIRCVPTRD